MLKIFLFGFQVTQGILGTERDSWEGARNLLPLMKIFAYFTFWGGTNL
jgi:hypothetical protein